MLYQPTNLELVQQADGLYIARFDVELYKCQTLSEATNHLNGNKRVITFDVEGEEAGTTETRTAQSAPYTRENEDGVEVVIMKGGKVRGTIVKSYA